MSIIRYPGSKAKLSQQIIGHFPDSFRVPMFATRNAEYREPFFGAGAIGLEIMRDILHPTSRVWINDIDHGMYSLWVAVRDEPGGLRALVQQFKPTAEKFYEFKKRDDEPTGDPVEDGFVKLALHRMSVSGFGYMSGGPIGGRNQDHAEYNVGCRWTPSRIERGIEETHALFAAFDEVKITNLDYCEVVQAGGDCFMYLDPPYYEKGPELYKHSMTHQDHVDLSEMLQVSPARWVLSYDDHPAIREMYSWAKFSEVKVKYSNAVTTDKRPKNKEVVITSG